MSKITFQVASRDLKQKSKQLRNQGKLPGNIFGNNKPSVAVTMPRHDFSKLYDEVGDSQLIYLKLDEAKKEIPVLVDEVQYDALNGSLLHVAFRQVDLKEKIQAEVPVVIEGEMDIPGAVLVTVKDTVTVEALPTDLPENFTIDATKLTEIGQSVTLADLEYDKEKVALVVGEEGEESPVLLVQEVTEEPEETEVEPVAEEGGEDTSDQAPAESETAVE